MGELLQDTHLDRWHKIAQHQVFAILVRFMDDRVKMLQNIELRVQGVTRIHVHMVLALPEKGLFPFNHLEAFRVHLVGIQQVNVGLWEIVSHDRNQIDALDKVTSAHADIRSGAAQDALTNAKGGF